MWLANGFIHGLFLGLVTKSWSHNRGLLNLLDHLGSIGTACTRVDFSCIVGKDSAGVECEKATGDELECSVGGVGKVFDEFCKETNTGELTQGLKK